MNENEIDRAQYQLCLVLLRKAISFHFRLSSSSDLASNNNQHQLSREETGFRLTVGYERMPRLRNNAHSFPYWSLAMQYARPWNEKRIHRTSVWCGIFELFKSSARQNPSQRAQCMSVRSGYCVSPQPRTTKYPNFTFKTFSDSLESVLNVRQRRVQSSISCKSVEIASTSGRPPWFITRRKKGPPGGRIACTQQSKTKRFLCNRLGLPRLLACLFVQVEELRYAHWLWMDIHIFIANKAINSVMLRDYFWFWLIFEPLRTISMHKRRSWWPPNEIFIEIFNDLFAFGAW